MHTSARITGFLAVILLPVAAQADGLVTDWGVAPRVSTLGLGIEVSKSVPLLNLTGRVGYNMFTYEYNDDIDGIDYDLDLDLQSVSALVDWRPFGQITHLTGGLLLNMNEVNAVGKTADDYEIGGTVYPADAVGTLRGDLGFDDIAPYVGIGWNVPIAPSFALSVDLGVVYQGAPDVSLTADGPLADQPDFMDSLAAEEEEFQNDIEDYKYYPVVSLGVRKRF